MRERAEQEDAEDELAAFRAEFYLPEGAIYLLGNSLGLLSRRAEAEVGRALQEWKRLGARGWTEAEPPWFYLAERLGAATAPLLGASPNEVVVTNSTTVNLHQLLATLFRPTAGRAKILTDSLGFPSDLYALQSHLRLRNLNPETHLVCVPPRENLLLEEDDLLAAMTEEIALVLLPGVVYATGQRLDMARITEEARRRGIVIGWDCAHSIGSVPHELSAWGADFAFWCGYKHLNGGPGAAGGLYLNQRHFGQAPGLAGWFSSRKETQFVMAPTLDAAPDAGALQIGTPNILSMAPLLGSLALFAEAGIERIRRKSLRLTTFLRELIESELAPFGFSCVTPEEEARRGGHLTLRHPQARALSAALRQAGVVVDFRNPDLLRMTPTALYNSFADCATAVERLRTILESGAALTSEANAQPVT